MIKVHAAYSLASRYKLAFVARKRGMKPGTVAVRKQLLVPAFELSHLNMDSSMSWEGAD
jgi:hypothetical protein